MKDSSGTPLLVVVGEASGDALAAPVVSALGVGAFGIGGPGLEAAGTELVTDFANLPALGIRSALGSVPALTLALANLVRATRARRPRAALLVGFSEVNARIASWLRRRRVKVLWYAPPQVWAWRPRRAARIGRAVDRLAVLLPFERVVWERTGARVDYVGHPAVDRARRARSEAGNDGVVVALLPGSRRREVLVHLPPMLDAIDLLRRRAPSQRVCARFVLSRSLSEPTRRWARQLARARGVPVLEDPIEDAIGSAHVALVASGTATLECAALRVPPVIVYRTDLVSHAVAKRLVLVPFVGLPNLVLGRGAFPELLQSRVTSGAMCDAALELLERRNQALATCDEVRGALSAGLDGGSAAERVARMLVPWFA